MKVCDCRPILETQLISAAEKILKSPFNEDDFLKKIQQVTLYSDYMVFSMRNGKEKSINRDYEFDQGKRK